MPLGPAEGHQANALVFVATAKRGRLPMAFPHTPKLRKRQTSGKPPRLSCPPTRLGGFLYRCRSCCVVVRGMETSRPDRTTWTGRSPFSQYDAWRPCTETVTHSLGLRGRQREGLVFHAASVSPPPVPVRDPPGTRTGWPHKPVQTTRENDTVIVSESAGSSILERSISAPLAVLVEFFAEPFACVLRLDPPQGLAVIRCSGRSEGNAT